MRLLLKSNGYGAREQRLWCYRVTLMMLERQHKIGFHATFLMIRGQMTMMILVMTKV
jgi:hypothetical protein